MSNPYDSLGEMIAGIAEAHATGVRTGAVATQLRLTPVIDALEREFQDSLRDPHSKLKTSLQIAITAVIAMVRSSEMNDYANAMVKREQLARHEERPEHDMTTFGTPLKAGA